MSARAAAIATLCLVAAGALAPADKQEAPTTKAAAEKLFGKPTPILDQDGKTILTRRAVGHPVVFDWNADGKNDIILGCHLNMDTATGEILLLENVGSRDKPKFRWPPRASVKLQDAGGRMRISCGCKSGGTAEVHVTDWNGDGWFDLVVDTFWSDGVRVLLNTGKSKRAPTFKRGPRLHRIGSHGMGSGGGDWDGDGIMDLVFPVNAHGWGVYPGIRGPKGQRKFAAKPALSSREFKIVGQERWFEHTPYAWNFSGAHGKGSKITEIVAVINDPKTAKRSYDKKLSRVNYYWLDRAAKTCTLKGTLAVNPAAYTRLGIGDLNSDGCMDVLYTGGVFTRGEETKIFVLYGKVKNIPAVAAGKKPARD